MNVRWLVAPNPGPFTLDGTRTYLLGETAVVDPGPAIEEHVAAIAAAMPRLEQILITHRHSDHAPGAIPLRERTGAAIVAPPGVLDDASVQRRVRGGEVLDAGDTSIEVIATPGHTREHVCYLTEDGALFTGDTVLGAGTTAIFPPDGSMGDYLASLRLLESRAPHVIYPAHGPVRDDAAALLRQYIEHREAREAQIVATLRSLDGATIPELRTTIYPDLAPGVAPAADAQLLAHLIKLLDEGKVVANGERYGLADRAEGDLSS